MPYERNRDLPKPVRDALPEEAQTVWRRAFNSAERQYGDEGRAAATAWAAVQRAGWEKDERTGKWVKVKKQGRFIAKSDKKYYTLGIVYEPDTVDSQGDFADAEEIEKACWNFMRRLQGRDTLTKTALRVLEEVVKAAESGESVRLDITDAYEAVQKRGLNDMHIPSENDEELGTIVECYIAPTDFEVNGETVKKGTWLLGVVWNPEYFEKIEKGERTGLSLEGTAIRVEVDGVA